MSFYKSTTNNTLLVSNRSPQKHPEYMYANGRYNENTSEEQVRTPPSGSLILMNRSDRILNDEEMIDMESTPAINTQSTCVDYENREHKFDSIARHVDKTIKDLDKIYSEIGFSQMEIKNKREEIFTVMEETILNFTASLSREKTNIENECEWLRQQIIIILAMLNDHNGEKILSFSNRGIVLNDMSMYEEGYKNEIRQKLHTLKSRKENFYEDSPFNVSTTSICDDEDLLQTQYEEVLQNIPKLSLVQLRAKLNMIFLETLQMFVASFKEFNTLAAQYYQMVSKTGDERISSPNAFILKSLPDQEEVSSHKDVIHKFETMLEWLNIPKKRYSKIASVDSSKTNDKELFIISSPRKKRIDHENTTNSFSEETVAGDGESVLAQLREINYRLIRIIRGLKITKITPETIGLLQNELENVQTELEERESMTVANIDKCFQIIERLELTEEQIFDVQHQYSLTASSDIQIRDYIDCNTLNTIRTNPKEFGLKTSDMKQIQNLTKILEKIKDSKEKKMRYYMNSCHSLWNKLGENENYINHFLMANKSLTDVSITNFKIELNRLYVKRSECIENFISKSRAEIESLWDTLHYSESERREFPYYDFDISNTTLDKEFVLNNHDSEINKLKEEFNKKEPILSLYEQLNGLLKDQQFLKESSKDSSRLLSKNSCKILLNEEKIRKRINKNVPKLLEAIKSKIKEYNIECFAKGESRIKVDGKDLLESVQSIESEFISNSGKKNRNRNSPTKPMRSQVPKLSPSKSMNSLNVSQNNSRTKPRPLTKRSPSMNTGYNQQPKSTKISKTVKLSTQRPRSNNAHLKTESALNSSMKIESFSSSLDSPEKSDSFGSKQTMTQLPPLNSSLKPNKFFSFGSTSGNNSSDTIRYLQNSSISNISPILSNKISGKDAIDSLSYQKLSPVRADSAEYMEDKENIDFGLSPVKLTGEFFSAGERVSTSESSNRLSIFTCDSSTIIGDDYQQWRNERIKQFSDIS